MKCTPTGQKWAHVSCVLWIPEVSIGCAEKMEPITKISSIPASRWSLVCVLCRERKGACIQCSVKTCKTAYHVTCAFKHGLEMRAIIEDENADDGVKLRSYCQKHSVNSKKEKCPGSGSEEEEVKRKRRKDMTSEEKTQARAARLQEIEREFDRHVGVKDISTHLLDVDQDAIQYIYNYWKLKRRAGHNRPLLPPKFDDNELLTHRQEQADLDKMKMFVQLRQDLERVRNLCYMVSRREKLSRSFFRMREQTFHKQVAVLSAGASIPELELNAIIEANHGPSIYDRLYSHPNALDHKNDFEDLLARIAPLESGDEKKKDRNGLVRRSKSSNPYKKHYVNGSRRSGSMYSGLSSEESAPEMSRTSRYRGRAIGSSTEEEVKKPTPSPKKKVSPKAKCKRSPKKTERKKKKVPQSKAVVESSSDDELLNSRMKKDRSRSKTLQQMEKEMTAGKLGQSGTDSDELMPIRTTRNNKFPVDIYSDSSDEPANIKPEVKTEKGKADKTRPDKNKTDKSPTSNDSQQPLPRTKAAMKEFISTQPEKKVTTPEEEKPAPKKRGRKPSNKDKKLPVKNESDDEAKNKENIKFTKQKDNPTDLIVPQRQAAKKASENMRSTAVVKKDEAGTDKPATAEESKPKPKLKGKDKEIKEVPTRLNKRKSKELEKEPIAYVPQRQAAKKAAAHIKSGLGSKAPVVETENDKKKDSEKPETSKVSPKKDDVKGGKAAQKESSSSSSNSSSSSYSSSSSSEEEQEKPEMKPTAKAREIKPAIRQPSMFSPPGTRPTVDLPFLDKVSRPLSSTSGSSDSDSSKESERSGSESPTPKRPRRRRKGKSVSTDASPRKAPDKKLKTSERRSECRVPSPASEGEEPTRPNDTRAATRARTRSTTASGNLSDKPDARLGKTSKDDTSVASGANKSSKENVQSCELPPSERKTDEAISMEDIKEEAKVVPTINNEIKPKVSAITKTSVDTDDKDMVLETAIAPIKPSPKKTSETKQKTLMNRRMSVKEPPKEQKSPLPEILPIVKEGRHSEEENSKAPIVECKSLSPNKKSLSLEKSQDVIEIKSPIRIADDFHDNDDKHWLPKAPSPTAHPTPVEKPGGNEKYMTEDKSLDSDSTDKSSVKMIAKIQANLNENTMIKSPKTPMDARTNSMEHMDVENPMIRNIRKRSILDPEKKFITQDASHVQGVEISKSAKIPSAVNPYPNRAMFSPQPKENELFEYEMVAIDDGFNHDDIMKPFASYPEFFFKEDSKEQGVQETLNLVDRLRMQLSSKKVNAENSTQENPIPVTEKEDKEMIEIEIDTKPIKSDHESETAAPEKDVALDLQDKRIASKPSPVVDKHLPEPIMPLELSTRRNSVENKEFQPIAMTSSEKWATETVTSHIDLSMSQSNDRKYEHTNSYNEVIKEPATVQSDVQSISENADTISLSKQSDDSQPLSVVDHSMLSNDHDITQDNQNYDNNNSLLHSDCATISSPYISQEKWRESKITTRRSSASSTNSEASIMSHKTDLKSRLGVCTARQITIMPEIDSYPPVPAYSCPVEPSMPLNQYSTYPPDASPFLTTMTLPLFTTGPSSQLSLPSPGGIYATGLSYANTSLLPKASFPMCAAFTSSSQNIAITTAMIASPTPKGLESPRDEIDVTGSDKFSIHVVSSPSVSVDSYEATNRTKMSNDSNEAMMNLQILEPKSPSKSNKPMTRFPTKSPGKSPGISPKQSDPSKGTKRSSTRSNRSQRGRGRSKSRGHVSHSFQSLDYTSNSIQSKLVGTVYDFDEEIANDGVDLKALRERCKSIDVCKSEDRKSDHSYKDRSRSPDVISPQHSLKKPPTEDIKDVKTFSPENERVASPDNSSPERGSGFSQVHPVLPGPVDMRTYQPFENPVPVVGDGYHSHLLAFASGTADQHLPDIDEEVENQLHSALMSSNPKEGSPSAVAVPEPVTQPLEVIPQPKVSLSDSRNQLKVKIKGPFLDANYATSSSQPVAPPPPAPVLETNPSVFNTAGASGSSMMSGSTNLRRMRKKELLRQYWTQDMNMDDPAASSAMVAPPPAAPSPLTRAVITIPKAVASMTSIPTREDYKITEAPVEKKKRKVTSGLSRELRHLEVSMNDDVDPSDDVKLSTIAGTSNQTHKRRGRASTKPNKTATSPVAPKLKIKIGPTNAVHQVNEEPSSAQFRPPKKRLIHKPSLEDIRRESMKFRRKVMADFEENEKEKKCKLSKTEKRKKKKDKKLEKLEIIKKMEANKLIIKIKLPKDDETEKSPENQSSGPGPSGAAMAAAAVPEPPVDPFEYDPTAPDPLAIDTPSYAEASSAIRKIRTAKVTPIRLKLARTAQGSGYVMKDSGDNSAVEEASASTSAATTAATAPPASPASPLPMALNKHCEVR
ncbi:hypothetical protein O3G_MSEX008140 [Manduca sexta]|nr:hypothetical protein O3G_MSEX008140 [Manduca sexta]